MTALKIAFVLLALWLARLLWRRLWRWLMTRGPYEVVCIWDGDTIDVRHAGAGNAEAFRVRLRGIDAPETNPQSEKARRDARSLGESPSEHARRGHAARSALEAMLQGRRVALEYRLWRRRGYHGRDLARVWVLGEDGRSLFEAGEKLLERGLVRRS